MYLVGDNCPRVLGRVCPQYAVGLSLTTGRAYVGVVEAEKYKNSPRLNSSRGENCVENEWCSWLGIERGVGADSMAGMGYTAVNIGA